METKTIDFKSEKINEILSNASAMKATEEEGLFIADEAGNVALKIDSDGVHFPDKNFDTIPEPKRLIRIDVTATSMPTSKDETNPILTYGKVKLNIDEHIIEKYASFEIQGASSASYDKKNYTICLYEDSEYSNEYSFRLNNMIPQSEYIFKANYIDATQSRNIICNRLWEQIVMSRTGYPKRENEVAYSEADTDIYHRFNSGAICHVDGFPCVMYLNGKFYGIGTFNIGKKRDNYDLQKNTQTHIMMTAEEHVNFASYTASDWEIKNPKTPDADFSTRIAVWFAANAMTGDEFKTNFETYHDLQNSLDYYLFVNFLKAGDCIFKNFILTSWDAVKYFFCPYDLDTTFGLRWDGLALTGYDGDIGDSTSSITGNEFWTKFRNAYGTDLKSRYKDLRDKDIFSVDNVYRLFSKFMAIYGHDMFKKEFDKWDIPSNSDSITTYVGTGGCYTGLPQILNWTKERLNVLDTLYDY